MALRLSVDDDDFRWAVFYAEHAPTLRKFIRRRVPHGVAEDTLQEVFVRAFRSRSRLDPHRPVWPWLVTIAIRACAEARRVHPPELASDDVGAQTVATDDLHATFEAHQRREMIGVTMAQLSPRHRRVLARWEIDGTSFTELAEDEGLTPQALKSVLCRARSNFRKSYRDTADRIGLVAWPLSPRILRRLRRSLGRVEPAGGGRLAEVVFGSLAVVACATRAGIVPTSAGGERLHLGESAGHVAVVSDERLEGRLPNAWSARHKDHTAAKGGSGHATRSAPAAESPKLPVGATGRPDVRLTPEESTASITLDWTNPAGDGSSDTAVTVKCAPGIWTTTCALVRSTPGGN